MQWINILLFDKILEKSKYPQWHNKMAGFRFPIISFQSPKQQKMQWLWQTINLETIVINMYAELQLNPLLWFLENFPF